GCEPLSVGARSIGLAAALAMAATLSACGSSGAASGTSPNTSAAGPAQTPTPQAPVSTVAPRPASQAPAVGGAGFVMPNLVGRDLQSAQDAIQALTNDDVFFTTSHDATGQGRHQILDRNWRVCSQNLPTGTPFGADAHIDFGVVRVDTETCP
ncbi:MAG: SPOR domain-containing protein, partial [Geodermatophilaceae bacterium]